MGPGFHPLVPAAIRPAAAPAPAMRSADEVDVSPACAKPSRFQALMPAGAGLPQRKPFALPRLLVSAPADVHTGAHGDGGGSASTGDDPSAEPEDGTPGDPSTPASRPGGFTLPQRKPFAMAVAVTPTSAARSSPATSLDEPVYIEVFFTKFSKKKKKVWEDGVLVLKQGSMELQRDDGSAVTKSNKNCSKGNAPPEIGSILFLGSFEVTAVLPPLLPSCSLF